MSGSDASLNPTSLVNTIPSPFSLTWPTRSRPISPATVQCSRGLHLVGDRADATGKDPVDQFVPVRLVPVSEQFLRSHEP